MRHGIKLSPRDRRLAFWGWALGVLLLRANRADEALDEAHLERDEIRAFTCRRSLKPQHKQNWAIQNTPEQLSSLRGASDQTLRSKKSSARMGSAQLGCC